jgi:hypothetical protein
MEYILMLAMVFAGEGSAATSQAILFPNHASCLLAKDKFEKRFTTEWQAGRWRSSQAKAECAPRWVQEASQ